MKEQRLRFQVIKALNSIRANYPMIRFNQKPLERAMLAEIEIYYRLNMVLYMLNQKAYRTSTMIAPGDGSYHGSRARRLLIQAIQEKMDQAREIVFRFLGLGYDARDIYNAYLGITSNQQSLRANSVEFIDNILSLEYKRYIIPMLDSHSAKSLVEPGGRLFNLEIPPERYALDFLLDHQDYWLKTCALYFISDLKKDTYVDAVDNLRNNVDPVVAETAEYAFKRIAGKGN
jgi:hypothetical protein